MAGKIGVFGRVLPRPFWFVGAAVLLVIVTYLGAHTPVLAAAFTHQPERYTELYFTNPEYLPSVATFGQELPVVFVVHNVEDKAMRYTYRIVVENAHGVSVSSGSRSLPLGNGQSDRVSGDVAAPSVSGRTQVQVQLVNVAESIHYWVEVNR